MLQKDNVICTQIKQRFLQKKNDDASRMFSIDDVSKATGITPTTIDIGTRYGLYRLIGVRSISALYNLCRQVELNKYDGDG